MAKAPEFQLTLDGVDASIHALKRAQPAVRKKTVPVMRELAEGIASGAQGRAQKHPSGLWSGSRGRNLAPKYNVKQDGPYWLGVETPGGAVGRAEAMSEFAAGSITPQGAGMVRVLSGTYGRTGGSGGGRILWAEFDAQASDIEQRIQEAVDEAAEQIEREANGA